MTPGKLLAAAAIAGAGALCALVAGPAAASPCTDQVGALEKRLDNTAESAGAASSSGQGVAAARESRAQEARNENRPASPGAPVQGAGQEAQATQQAANAGGGGDRVMQAKASLNRARSFDAQGNAQGCMQALEEAKKQIGG